MSARCFVYAIGAAGGPTKIGMSSSPHRRLQQMQTGCPFKLQVVHTHDFRTRREAEQIEATIHDVYEAQRLHGEWFSIDEEVAREAIETAVEIAEVFRRRF